MTEVTHKKKIRNDLILIGLILLVAAIGLTVFLLTREKGARVVVNLNGTEYASYSLSDNITVRIPSGESGDRLNVLTVQDGQAWISEADCPDLICAHHKPISHEGETIVCLPNKLVVAVE